MLEISRHSVPMSLLSVVAQRVLVLRVTVHFVALIVFLLERRDIATGATGRNHGLLHSGARYAVNDQESAEECIKRKTAFLRKICASLRR